MLKFLEGIDDLSNGMKRVLALYLFFMTFTGLILAPAYFIPGSSQDSNSTPQSQHANTCILLAQDGN